MSHELYKVLRPKTLEEVSGQPQAVSVLKSLFSKKKVPHAMLFTGPSGCGKTTLARIVRDQLKCSKDDFYEVNCADFRGIEMVRDIRQRMGLKALDGPCRIWLIDEAHQLSKDAQNAMLKLLEDTPSIIYFMLATTDPGKLITAIKTRCTEIKVKLLSGAEMLFFLTSACKAAKITLHKSVSKSLVDAAEGSPRKLLVLLDGIKDIEDTDSQIDAIQKNETKTQAIAIARALINPRCNWAEVSALLKDLEDEPETVRRIVLGYANSVLLGGGGLSKRAFLLIQVFRDHLYDCGKAGLTANCYEVANAK